jgi:hypothetical protein
MASKKQELLDSAKKRTRKPNLNRFEISKTEKKGYRVVPVSLYSNEANWVDEITENLKQAGYPKANRSMVIREAISALQSQIQEKDKEELFDYFLEKSRQT